MPTTNRPFVPPDVPLAAPATLPGGPAPLSVPDKLAHLRMVAAGCAELVGCGAGAWAVGALGLPGGLWAALGLLAVPGVAAVLWGLHPLWREWQHGRADLAARWELLTEHQEEQQMRVTLAGQWGATYLRVPEPKAEPPIPVNRPAASPPPVVRPPIRARYAPLVPSTLNTTPAQADTERTTTLPAEQPTRVLPRAEFTPDMRRLVEMAINGVAPSLKEAQARGMTRDEWTAAKEALITAQVFESLGERKACKLDDSRFKTIEDVEQWLAGR